MRLQKERFEESAQLIREHLVTLHDDGDNDSLFVRMGEILNYIEDLKWDIGSSERCMNVMSEFGKKLQDENRNYRELLKHYEDDLK